MNSEVLGSDHWGTAPRLVHLQRCLDILLSSNDCMASTKGYVLFPCLCPLRSFIHDHKRLSLVLQQSKMPLLLLSIVTFGSSVAMLTMIINTCLLLHTVNWEMHPKHSIHDNKIIDLLIKSDKYSRTCFSKINAHFAAINYFERTHTVDDLTNSHFRFAVLLTKLQHIFSQ